MDFLGTHGTCTSRAEEIISQGKINPSDDGLLGSGVYLWSYIKDIELAKRRAQLWWKFATKQGRYAKEANVGCAVLNVKATLDDEKFYLDATDEEFLEKFYRLFVTKQSIINLKTDLGRVFALFLDETQKLNDFNFLIIKVSVPNPAPVGGNVGMDWVHVLSKMGSAYIVKEKEANLINEISLIV